MLNKLRAFQDAGHTVVLIIGDYTARVGDPSGRDATRPVLSEAEIEANARTYQEQAFAILDRSEPSCATTASGSRCRARRSSTWSRRFTVARLLEREDFTQRMAAAQPISALELLYPVLQGYDSVAVAADVELGATDQRFNLLFARDVQIAYGQAPQSILTMPILPGIDGVRKMSKSYGNYVGVTDPAEQIFGKLMSIPDSVMGRVLPAVAGGGARSRAPPRRGEAGAGAPADRAFPGGRRRGEAEAGFDQVHVRGELPDEISVARAEARDAVHLPALIAAEFGSPRARPGG